LTVKEGLLSALPVSSTNIPITTNNLYVQAADSGGGANAVTSQNTAQVFDNFAIAAGATITRVGWQGLYVVNDLVNYRAAPAPTATTFTVAFYADNGGAPGALLSTANYASASVNENFVGTNDAFHLSGSAAGAATQAAFYSYSVQLSSTFTAAP